MSTPIKALGLAGILTAAMSTTALSADGALNVDTNGSLSVGAGDSSVSTEAGVTVDTETDTGGLEATTDVATDTEVETEAGSMAEVDADAKMKGNGADKARYGQIIAGINAGEVSVDDVEALGEDVTVSTVELDELKSTGNVTALENAIERNIDGEELRAAVEANAALQTAVEADGFETEDVVAVHSDAQGHVWVIVQDS